MAEDMYQSPPRQRTGDTNQSNKPFKTLLTENLVPLNDPRRTMTMHPLIPELKIPASASTSTSDAIQTTTTGTAPTATVTATTDSNLNPITLQPWTADDLRFLDFESLRKMSPAELIRQRDDDAKELRRRLDEYERKVKEIDRQKEEKEKMREIERKVYKKKLVR